MTRSMDELREYVLHHTVRLPMDAAPDVRRQFREVVDVEFFLVGVGSDADASCLQDLVQASENGFAHDMNPFDGNLHSYLEVGGWIGDQGLALHFMGLAHALKLAEIPSLGGEIAGVELPSQVKSEMLRAGALCIQTENPERGPT
jgi:hypothetical protein